MPAERMREVPVRLADALAMVVVVWIGAGLSMGGSGLVAPNTSPPINLRPRPRASRHCARLRVLLLPPPCWDSSIESEYTLNRVHFKGQVMASEGDIQQSIHKALQANKDHQYALRIYSERIDAELESLNKLLVRSTSTLCLESLFIDLPGCC